MGASSRPQEKKVVVTAEGSFHDVQEPGGHLSGDPEVGCVCR